VLLSDLELLPAQGLAPRFSISMQLINPNNSQIAIEGGSFRLYLENSRVAAGVIEKPFLVPALGQLVFKAQCTGDLIGGASLFHKLMHSNAQAIEYQLEVTLHESNLFIPIRLQRDGVVNLSDI
jgi:LEA14-like dessication related protein